ncbi:Starch-binding associating with outer membrane [Saccharicrinis carchari]|uniref:Starch-binding associating with outer membrane n=1 Tax=Saccharicrinis carchari TaxID=1168039 RepID=A0A521F560_SACCC|nr:RagB/SusD family nutrient uptake outer membrane protein [Saccharicrinis carchari]SMO91328.1 Starch-binding associating with outer membrane [Saccharicrinis carchari]
MKLNISKWILGMALVVAGLSSCVNDLDTIPLDKNTITSATFYDNPESYRQVLAKIYGGLSLTGQVGPDGDQDVLGIDEGASNYIRAYWYMQDMTTEMALWIWSDPGIPELQTNEWTSANEISLGMYYRIFYQIALANELIRESSEGKLNGRGVADVAKEDIFGYRAEARFLRALSYYHALDLYGSVPFVTENDNVGAFLPQQISKQDLFAYIETELKELETLLPAPGQNMAGRVDVAAAWMVLAKLYLNAEVYISTPKYTEVLTYSKKVIDSKYKLDANYQNLFLADNHTADGIILGVVNDGINALSWGGTTMIACSAWASDMDAFSYGINAWGGNRARKQLIDKFVDYTGATDKRAMFYATDRTATTDVITEFKNGYSVMKYKNITSDGSKGSNIGHMDIDFPLLRTADAYLMYAEAVLRGATGGTTSEALSYVNEVRQRAYGGADGNIQLSELTLDFILDERAREFYWEGYRRTDLVRFNKFTSGDYLWEWKGGVYEGKALPDHFNHFPIPASDINANPNLKQDGY